MGILVLVRHGESRWNQCNRFTGWIDVPLSEKGIKEAQKCAVHCKEYEYAAAFTSNLTRAQSTALIILSLQGRTGIFQHDHNPRYSRWVKDSNRCDAGDLPIYASDALNERYYGDLQGMDKDLAEKKYGKEKLLAWRRGYTNKPPRGESLKQTYERLKVYFHKTILPRVVQGENILITAHGNTLRAIVKHLEGLSNDDIAHIDLPEAKPIIYQFEKNKFTRLKGDYRLDRPLR